MHEYRRDSRCSLLFVVHIIQPHSSRFLATMKHTSFFLALISLTAARGLHVLGTNANSHANTAALGTRDPQSKTPGHLTSRTDSEQQLHNPDQEPTWTDQVTGSTYARSQILTGVGPEAADERQFDWDESCTDPRERRTIIKAWADLKEADEPCIQIFGRIEVENTQCARYKIACQDSD